MKIGLRILLGYFLIVGLAAWFLLNVFMEQVKPGVRSTLEDTLVDTSQLLASLVAPDLTRRHAGRVGACWSACRITRATASTSISMACASRPSITASTITDRRGIVLFDSSGRDVGRDYSRWNDVYLTLQGKYGARSTRSRARTTRCRR